MSTPVLDGAPQTTARPVPACSDARLLAAHALLAEYLSEPAVGRSPAALGADSLALLDLADMAQVGAAEALDAFANANGPQLLDASPGVRVWVADRSHRTRESVGRLLHRGRALRALPALRASAATAAVPAESVGALANAVVKPALRAAVVAAEDTLVDFASRYDAHAVRTLLDGLAARVDPDGTDAKSLHRQDRLGVYLHRVGDYWSLRGTFSAEDGEVLHLALEAGSRRIRLDRLHAGDEQSALPEAGEDSFDSPAPLDLTGPPLPADMDLGHRWPVPSALRSDALIALAGHFLRTGETSPPAGVPTTLTVLVPLDTLNAAAEGADPSTDVARLAADLVLGAAPIAGNAQTLSGQALRPRAVERLACGASLDWLILSPTGEALAYGRGRREPTVAQRKTIAARDRGCRWVGCHASPSQCEAHHAPPWDPPRGSPPGTPGPGRTDTDAMVLLCRRHHHDHHDRGHPLRIRAPWALPGDTRPWHPTAITNAH